MLTSRELATVLAALRYWQQDLDQSGEDGVPIDEEHFKDEEPLTSEQIDALCERINVKDIRPRIIEVLEKCVEWFTRLEEYPEHGKRVLLSTMPNNFGRQMIRDLIGELGGPAQDKPSWKVFKIASVSANRNSFGLHGIILISRDGEGWQVGSQRTTIFKKGDVVNVPMDRDTGRLMFERHGFEIPEKLALTAPGPVLSEIWKEEESCPKKKSSSSSERTGKPPSKSSARSAAATTSRSPLKKGGK
jgi:hypothetical protein